MGSDLPGDSGSTPAAPAGPWTGPGPAPGDPASRGSGHAAPAAARPGRALAWAAAAPGRDGGEPELIGVVGAGTMGSGIARVAVEAGFRVLLYDVEEGALQRARQRLAAAWERREAQGRLRAGGTAELLGRLVLTGRLDQLAPAGTVIEAAPEDLGLKQRLFADLGRLVRPGALLASNTSSLSITAIARHVPGPERVIGLHFFNPVPAMALVEVVRGAFSSEEAVRRGVELATRLGKTPVVCADTPGFIVNRVARPYYGEALRLLGEGIAGVDGIDRLLRAAGFPMGPFELIDLVGVDVNLAVTRSVYEAFFGEPRFRPHPIQRQLVEAGWLGRKAGRGFYHYDGQGRPAGVAWRRLAAAGTAGTGGAPGAAGSSPAPEAAPAAAQSPAATPGAGGAHEPVGGGETPGPVLVIGGGPVARELARRLAGRAGGPDTVVLVPDLAAARSGLAGGAFPGSPAAAVVTWEEGDPLAPGLWERRGEALAQLEEHLAPDALLLVSTHAQGVAEQAAALHEPARVAGFAAVPPLGDAAELVAGPASAEPWLGRAGRLLAAAGLRPERVGDAAGGVVPRVLAMLVNEAILAEDEGIATGDAIDRAMELGTGYPRGPLAWAELWGWERVLDVLEGLRRAYGEDRYRPAAGLRRRIWAARAGARRRGAPAPGGTG